MQPGFPNHRVGEHIRCSLTAFYAVVERSLHPPWYPKRDRLGPFSTPDQADGVREHLDSFKQCEWRVERVDYEKETAQ